MSYWEDRSDDTGRELDPLIASLQAPPRYRVRRGTSATKVNDLSEQLRSIIAPQFQQMESELSVSIDQLQSHLSELESLYNQTRDFVEQFQNQIDLSKEDFDAQWSRLSDWDDHHDDVSKMRYRVRALQEKLTESKKRLLGLDQAITATGKEAYQREHQVQLWGRIILALVVVAIAIGIKLLWYR